MRSCLLLLLSFFICQQSVWSYVNLHGRVADQRAKNITVIYSNSWLDPLDQALTVDLDSMGYFSMTLQFKEKLKPAYLIYGTDTLELVFTTGEELMVNADAKDFKKTIYIDGAGSANAQFCLKHQAEMGMLMRRGLTIRNLYRKNIPDFLKAIKLDYKKEMDYLSNNGKDVTPVFARYWRLSLQYENYCDIFAYPNTHPRSTASYKILDSIPAAYNDEFMLVPQYRLYVQQMANKYWAAISATNNSSLMEQRKKLYRELLFTKMPAQTGEFAGASIIYSLIKTDKTTAENELEEFKKHFPNSRYLTTIKYLLKG